MEKLTILVDGKNMLYRHNYTGKVTDLKGNKVSGVHGMIKELGLIIKNMNPTDVVVCWDIGKSRSRLELYPEYKGNRRKNEDPEVTENLIYQQKHIQRIVKFLPIKQLGVSGVEADDIIGFLCKQVSGKKIIFSNDSDFIQLVDSDTSLFLATKKKLVSYKNIEEYLGYDPKFYRVWKSMVGDASDNIKGIDGIGEKTAIKIIKGQKKVPLNKEIMTRNMKLITIGHLLSVDDKKAIVEAYKSEKIKKPNSMAIRTIFTELGFTYYLMNFNYMIGSYRRFSKSFN